MKMYKPANSTGLNISEPCSL